MTGRFSYERGTLIVPNRSLSYRWVSCSSNNIYIYIYIYIKTKIANSILQIARIVDGGREMKRPAMPEGRQMM